MPSQGRFVKFGIAHRGACLQYASIFHSLNPKCIEGILREDGVRYVLLTLKGSRTPSSVHSAIEIYNLSCVGEPLDVLKLTDLHQSGILTFSHVERMHEHEFYKEIAAARSTESSSYWCCDAGGYEVCRHAKPAVKLLKDRRKKKKKKKKADGRLDFKVLFSILVL